jgi:hypothetical protein
MYCIKGIFLLLQGKYSCYEKYKQVAPTAFFTIQGSQDEALFSDIKTNDTYRP